MRRWLAGIIVLACGRAPAAPFIEVVPPGSDFSPGKPVEVNYLVSWPEDAHSYSVFAEQLPEVDWGAMKLVRAEARRAGGRQELRFTVRITARETGEFVVPELTFSYLDPERLQEQDVQEAPNTPSGPSAIPSLRAASFPIRVTPDATPAWTAGALGIILFLTGGLGWWLWRRSMRSADDAARRSGGMEPPRREPVAEAQAALGAAERAQMEGDARAFYRHLRNAVSCVAPGSTELLERLNAAEALVSTGGARAHGAEMDRDLRATVNLVNRLKEDY